jgi:coenzyme F420-reducing hydrogenase delta subunit
MTETFEPTHWFHLQLVLYRAADMAGTARMKYPPNVR